MNTDETLPNGTEFIQDGAKYTVIAFDGTHYQLSISCSNRSIRNDAIIRKYVEQWHGDYLARGLTTKGGEATGRKSRPVRIVPY